MFKDISLEEHAGKIVDFSQNSWNPGWDLLL